MEIEDCKPHGLVGASHVYLAPSQHGRLQTQMWVIEKHANKDFEYVIRSLATGYVLDIVYGSDNDGAKVGGYPWQPGAGNETWNFCGTRQGAS